MNGGAAEAMCVDVGTDGGVHGGVDIDVDKELGIGKDGGAKAYQCVVVSDMTNEIADTSYSPDVLADFIAFLTPLSIPLDIDIVSHSLIDEESDIIWNNTFSSAIPVSLFIDNDQSSAFQNHNASRSFDLSKEPLSYKEAMAWPDADAWIAAIEQEKRSLEEMGAFEEVELPSGERTIGLKWVFAYKTNLEGKKIAEKARIVAQGYNQRPGQFGETYAPVARMTSIRILLTWAAVQDLDIYQFDCKTAFLHAKIRHPIYACQFLGYMLKNSGKVLRILVALYGL
jgi:Reverse transcriptase (RNA-dependent DNA polymerase)